MERIYEVVLQMINKGKDGIRITRPLPVNVYNETYEFANEGRITAAGNLFSNWNPSTKKRHKKFVLLLINNTATAGTVTVTARIAFEGNNSEVRTVAGGTANNLPANGVLTLEIPGGFDDYTASVSGAANVSWRLLAF